MENEQPLSRLMPPTIAMGGGTFEPAVDGSAAPRRHPDWIKARIPSGETYQEVRRLLYGLSLHTVCEEAHCPNVGECWDQRTATIMILGDVCTRACGSARSRRASRWFTTWTSPGGWPRRSEDWGWSTWS